MREKNRLLLMQYEAVYWLQGIQCLQLNAPRAAISEVLISPLRCDIIPKR